MKADMQADPDIALSVTVQKVSLNQIHGDHSCSLQYPCVLKRFAIYTKFINCWLGDKGYFHFHRTDILGP